VLAVIGLVLGCAGVRGSIATGHDEVRALYGGGERARIEYLGEGCYLVDDRAIYECTVDAVPAGERICLQTSAGPGLITRTVRHLWIPGDVGRSRELPTGAQCDGLREDHDRRHGMRCRAHVVITQASDLDVTYNPILELDEQTSSELAAGLGKTWFGMSPLTYRREVCIDNPAGEEFPDIYRSTGSPSLDSALEAHVIVVGGRPGCVVLAISVYGLEHCAL
jgi:hypothetical protein